jgi:hypothetical protein
MHRTGLPLVWLVFAFSPALLAQPATTQPQSARQALIEMFTGKGPDDFAKHLPDAARRSLIHKGETAESSVVLRISEIGRQITGSGARVETFDAGPNILVSESEGSHERVEIAVEHDSLLGEEDEIELSVHAYKNGEPELLPVIPRLIFTLKQEKEIWKLVEVTAAVHVPLTDPEYLKSLRKQQDEANESAAQMRVRVIAGAEIDYAAKHPERGFTCTLATLFAPTTDAAPEEGGGYYDPSQANNESNGYRFTLSGCDGNPASKYRLLAEPADPDSEMKTFCADQSGTVKSLEGEAASGCFSHGSVVDRLISPSTN